MLTLLGCGDWVTEIRIVDSDVDLPESGQLLHTIDEGTELISAGQLVMACDTPTTCDVSALRDVQSLESEGLVSTFWFPVEGSEDTDAVDDAPGEEDPRAVHEGAFGDVVALELRLP